MVGHKVKMYTPTVTTKIAPAMMTFLVVGEVSNRCILLWSEKGEKHLTWQVGLVYACPTKSKMWGIPAERPDLQSMLVRELEFPNYFRARNPIPARTRAFFNNP